MRSLNDLHKNGRLNLESQPLEQPKVGNLRRFRIAAGVIGLVGLAAGSALLIFGLAEDRPNLYDPTRIALVEAQRDLSEAYGHATQEKALFKQVRAAHHALDKALTFLEKAERLDPIDKSTIENLRTHLNLLEDDQKILHMTNAELRRTYQELFEQMQALIKRRE
jgi:hypothetical protein